MKRIPVYVAVLLLALAGVWTCPAQGGDEEPGFEAGNFRILPVVQALGAYEKDEGAAGDFYGETEAGLRLENAEARYDVGASASYGYRAYEQDSDLNDDFYGFGVQVSSQQTPLKTGLSGQYKKTVDYDTRVAEGTGSELGAIITRSTSTRTSARVDVGYERPVTGNSALLPSYEYWYYQQSFENAPDAEWQEHFARLRYGYNLESSVVLTLTGSAGLQLSDEEDGTVLSVYAGAESRSQEKFSWKVQLGVSTVDYEQSGTDQGLEGSLNLRWQATEKLSAYLFGGSSYQPGYAAYSSGSARQVYRAGYGGEWAILERLRLGVQVLHDRQEDIRSGQVDNGLYADARLQYDLIRNISTYLAAGMSRDDQEPDRQVVSLGAAYRF